MQLTMNQLKAVEWCVGNFAVGDASDCGGDKRLYRSLCKAHAKLRAEIEKREKKRHNEHDQDDL